VFAVKASSIFEYQQGKGSPRLQGASIRSCYAQAQSPTERCSDVFERSEGGIHKISYQEGKIGQNNSAVFVDAKIEPGVKIVGTFPADSHPPIIYPVAATTNAKAEAADYLAFLRSSEAKAIFEKYGFSFLVSPTT